MSGMWTMTHVGSEYSERLLTFTDVNGKFLLTCKESGNTVIVNNGDRLFGVIRGTRELSGLIAENTLGEEIFRIVREESKFNFESKDAVLATACCTETNEGATSWVEFSPTLDINTKTMITVVTYYLNVIFATETCCCCSGVTAPTTLTYLAPLIMFFLFVVFVKVIFKLIQQFFSGT
ncbi:unnamed protein product [Allacma fusca]|uniref:Uncharacterized protein n=1 Tax=Allacma fusca TaxID=39272 RepID=A0A8J2PKQ5_9HEXA|nr:unnamed protein product [Allacma fusca]